MNKINTVCLPDGVYADKSNGDSIQFQGNGTLEERDGKRYLSVLQVDGVNVSKNESPKKEEVEDDEEPSEIDSEDALNKFMTKKGKKVHPGMGEDYSE